MQERWRIEPNGDQSAMMPNLRIVVRDADGFTRFLLLKRPHFGGRGLETLLESGCENDVRAAKAKAVQRAVRLAAALRDGRQP